MECIGIYFLRYLAFVQLVSVIGLGSSSMQHEEGANTYSIMPPFSHQKQTSTRQAEPFNINQSID